jgi:DNA primase
MFQNYDKNNVWTDLQLLESGVINENRMVYFTNRIIFPIFNIEDKIVGFSGRTLTNEEPRYLNSKENGIFFKSKFLFNLNNVVKLSDVTNLYILEGYMDVIALHRAGVLNAVATMGVNLSSSHIETILAIENIKTVTLCFDNDEAGKLATFTNGISLLKSNIEVLVVNKNDEYKDMDALLKEKGKERLLSDLHNTSDFISYIIAIKLKESKLLTDVKEIFSIMIETNDILLKTKHLELICKMTGLHIDDVKTYYEQEKKKIVGDFSNKPHQEQFEVKEIKKNKNEEEKKINLFEINCRKILADFLFNAINKPQIIENFFSKIGFSIPQKYYPEFYNIFKILLLFVKEHDNEKQNYENFLNFVKEKCGMDVENEVKMFNDTNIRGSFETNYVEAGMKNIEQLKKKLLEYEIHLRLEKIKTEKDDKKIIGY